LNIIKNAFDAEHIFQLFVVGEGWVIFLKLGTGLGALLIIINNNDTMIQ
jgi:hypothetical protein